MKRFFLFFIAFALLLSGCTSAPRETETVAQTPKLSELSDDELLAFLDAYDIEIPYDYRDPARCAGFIRQIVTIVEDTPDFPFGYSYPVTLDFAETIRDAALQYYDQDDNP